MSCKICSLAQQNTTLITLRVIVVSACGFLLVIDRTSFIQEEISLIR